MSRPQAGHSRAQAAGVLKEWPEFDFDAMARAVVAKRRIEGLTQREVAELCGVEQTLLSKIERHRGSLSVDTTVRITGWLGLGMDFFVKPGVPSEHE